MEDLQVGLHGFSKESLFCGTFSSCFLWFSFDWYFDIILCFYLFPLMSLDWSSFINIFNDIKNRFVECSVCSRLSAALGDSADLFHLTGFSTYRRIWRIQVKNIFPPTLCHFSLILRDYYWRNEYMFICHSWYSCNLDLKE